MEIEDKQIPLYILCGILSSPKLWELWIKLNKTEMKVTPPTPETTFK